MAEFEVKDVRTVGILGANGSGKTTLVDALMYAAGANTRQGSVEQKTSLSDTDDEEKARQISIRTTPLNCSFSGKNLFLLDAPGYADFWGEVIVTLEVVDSVIIVIDAVAGVETGARRVWEAARKKGLPISFFVTKLDKEHSNFTSVLAALEQDCGGNLLPLFLPDGSHPNFTSVHDLRGEKAGELVDGALRDKLSGYLEKMVEVAAETDDALIEKYLESGELEPDEVKNGFQKAVAQGGVIPVFAGAAREGIGVKELLQAVCDVFPSPLDRGEIEVGEEKLSPDPSAPLCARVFKSVTDPFVGQISYLRVWSGTMKPETEVYNASSKTKERLSHLYLIKGKEQKSIPEALPGYVIALAKLKNTSVGDTICSTGKNYQFPPLDFPSLTAIVAVYPKSRGDEDKIGEAFHKATEEDPTLSARRDPMTNEFVLSGVGEVQLQVAVERFKKNFNVEVELREPKVAYLETLRSRGETKYRHKKQTGGAGQFAEVWMHVQPYTEGAENAPGKGKRELIDLAWGGKFLFVDEVVGGHIPTQLVQSVKKGYLTALKKGVLAGFPVTDVIATVYDGKTHPVDSKDIAFQIAGRQGFKEAAATASPLLLEPIMEVAITVLKEYMGTITGDLNARRGRVLGMNPEGAYQVIKAHVPMASLLKYATELRSMTGGSGEFSMKFDHYEEVPANLSQKIIEEKKRDEEE